MSVQVTHREAMEWHPGEEDIRAAVSRIGFGGGLHKIVEQGLGKNAQSGPQNSTDMAHMASFAIRNGEVPQPSGVVPEEPHPNETRGW